MKKNNTNTRRLALAFLITIIAGGSLSATSFHLGGGYSYTRMDYAFSNPMNEEKVEGKGSEHEATINTALYMGRNDNFGLGLDLNFRIPSKNSYENYEASEMIPWGIGANLSMISRTPFISSGNFGMHTKLGAGLTYRKSNASAYPVIHEGADKIEDMGINLLTGIGLYMDIAEKVSITAGIDFNVMLTRFYKASGSKGVENFNTPNWLEFNDVTGHETRGYVAVSYIF